MCSEVCACICKLVEVHMCREMCVCVCVNACAVKCARMFRKVYARVRWRVCAYTSREVCVYARGRATHLHPCTGKRSFMPATMEAACALTVLCMPVWIKPTGDQCTLWHLGDFFLVLQVHFKLDVIGAVAP